MAEDKDKKSIAAQKAKWAKGAEKVKLMQAKMNATLIFQRDRWEWRDGLRDVKERQPHLYFLTLAELRKLNSEKNTKK